MPSAFDTVDGLDAYLPLSQAIGFAVHDSAPDEVKAALGAAFEQAVASDVVAEWAATNNYTVSGAYGEEAQAIFANLEANFAYTLQRTGRDGQSIRQASASSGPDRRYRSQNDCDPWRRGTYPRRLTDETSARKRGT